MKNPSSFGFDLHCTLTIHLSSESLVFSKGEKWKRLGNNKAKYRQQPEGLLICCEPQQWISIVSVLAEHHMTHIDFLEIQSIFQYLILDGVKNLQDFYHQSFPEMKLTLHEFQN